MVDHKKESPVCGSRGDLSDQIIGDGTVGGVEDRREVDGGDAVGFGVGELGAVLGGLDEGLIEIVHGGKSGNGDGIWRKRFGSVLIGGFSGEMNVDGTVENVQFWFFYFFLFFIFIYFPFVLMSANTHGNPSSK